MLTSRTSSSAPSSSCQSGRAAPAGGTSSRWGRRRRGAVPSRRGHLLQLHRLARRGGQPERRDLLLGQGGRLERAQRRRLAGRRGELRGEPVLADPQDDDGAGHRGRARRRRTGCRRRLRRARPRGRCPGARPAARAAKPRGKRRRCAPASTPRSARRRPRRSTGRPAVRRGPRVTPTRTVRASISAVATAQRWPSAAAPDETRSSTPRATSTKAARPRHGVRRRAGR